MTERAVRHSICGSEQDTTIGTHALASRMFVQAAVASGILSRKRSFERSHDGTVGRLEGRVVTFGQQGCVSIEQCDVPQRPCIKSVDAGKSMRRTTVQEPQRFVDALRGAWPLVRARSLAHPP